MVSNPIKLYEKHFVDKQDERLELFRALVDRFGIDSALYPGSFVHIAPSLFIPEVVDVDTDRRACSFFGRPEVIEYVRKRRRYEHEPEIRFHGIDYIKKIDEPEGSFDLLISQYAGFVSMHCGNYLRPGGILLANNS
ncbi:MAG: class I SAM-dependent methyltransferase, partial [Theionarchaea archaeon]|nr:class I SAM-dependent methyltransferase [Theionarchaea archaeon]